MDKKKSQGKGFLNFFGTYKEVSQVADITTTHCLEVCSKQSTQVWI